MRRYIGISAGLLLLGIGIIGPAPAQGVYPPPGFPSPALPGFEITRIVSSHGLAPVTRPVRRGRNYVLLATDKSGQEMRVEVDARLGDIVGLRAPIPGEPYGPPIGTAALPPPGASAPALGNRPPSPAAEPALPRAAPNVSSPVVGAAAPLSASPSPPPAPLSAGPAPSRSAAAQPDLPPLPPPPPLPRPRPNLTAAEAAPETPAEPAAAKRRPPGVPAASEPPKDSAGLIE